MPASPLNTRRKGKLDTDSSESANVRLQSGVTAFSTSPSNLASQPFKSLAKSVSSTSSGQPLPSLNYYESYFDDSYVGDFSGEVDESRIEESAANLDVQNWCSDPSLNNSLLEFEYDSFGPESLLFTGNVPDQPEPPRNSLPDAPSEQECETGLMSLSVTNPHLNDKVNSCFDNGKIKSAYELNPEIPTELSSVMETELIPEVNANKLENNTETELDQEMPSAGTPLEEISPSEDASESSTINGVPSESEQQVVPSSDSSERDDSLSPITFSRNSTLSKSQRKKISPRINFEQILNSSDDVHSPSALVHANGLNPLGEAAVSRDESNRTPGAEVGDVSQTNGDAENRAPHLRNFPEG